MCWFCPVLGCSLRFCTFFCFMQCSPLSRETLSGPCLAVAAGEGLKPLRVNPPTPGLRISLYQQQTHSTQTISSQPPPRPLSVPLGPTFQNPRSDVEMVHAVYPSAPHR
ncbi:phosphoprotein [Rocahepevirus ratti]|nr:phosphoprotein [Rocahepevirus ratti]